MSTVNRFVHFTPNVTVHTNVASAETVEYENISGGIVMVPVGSTITSIKFHVQNELSEAWHVLADTAGVDVSVTVAAGKAVGLPTGLFAARTFRMVGDAIGTVSLALKQ